MIIARYLMNAEQALCVAAAFCLGHLSLVRQKRGRLGEKYTEGTQSSVYHLIAAILTGSFIW